MTNQNVHKPIIERIRKGYEGQKIFECGTCPNIIFVDNEPHGVLVVHNGKPKCAKCRIMSVSKKASEIKSDAGSYQEDKAEQQKLAEKDEMDKVMEVAYATQQAMKMLNI